MIFNLLLNFVLLIIGVLFVFFPIVTIVSIPVIGTQISAVLVTAVTTWNTFMVTFPYAADAWTILKWVIIPFEVLLLVVKLFLGSRMPTAK